MKHHSILVSDVGACSHRTAITVTDSAQQITLADGKNTLEITPEGDSDVFFGGEGVTAANGTNIHGGKVWANCKTGFSIYLVCDTGKTCDTRIAEYD